MVGCEGVLTSTEDFVACIWKQNFTAQAKMLSFDLKNRDLAANITVHTVTPFCISPDDKHLAFLHNHKLRICELSTGDLVKEITFLAESYDSCTGRTISYSPDGKYILLIVKLGRFF